MPMKSINPATGQLVATFDELSDSDVEARLQAAADAFQRWRHGDSTERSRCLVKLAELLEAEKDALATMMTEEMGKTRKSAGAEALKCALACRYFAEHGAAFLADERIETESDSFIRYLPLGTILAVMPWNFPFWQLIRCLAPAVMAGNTVILKHASNVPRCALALEELALRAGLPKGVFQSLLIGSSKVARIIHDPRVAAVTLTGSEAAGASVAEAAGRALKKCVLELGGNDPFIVLPSADLEAAVKTGIQARIMNNGQSCICAKRFIVHKDVYKPFVDRFVAGLEALVVGDPMDDATELGPIATADGVETLERQVRDSVAAGAKLLTGGSRLEGAGNFFAATALASVPRNAPAYSEEVFGPVAVLFEVSDLDEAIHLANDTPFGLASSVWTNDAGEQERLENEIEAGQTFVNAMSASDPRLPFGGIKASGFGRELGYIGAREFTNMKTIVAVRRDRAEKAA
ncbi:MAG: NAD-dependent succinate-semialdehyde dehydrogenase [Hyphomicrobiales bacterium]|nr:NAD-dependent succinate-semialdehyde dehydrogenase [Hyphomicrobiales bacterium]